MPEYKYRCTMVETKDYGDGPEAGVTSRAMLSVIPDGSRWDDRPQAIFIRVPVGTRPGGLYRVSIDSIDA